MNNLAILQALVFEPAKGWAELDARPRYWWPLLVFVIATAAVSFWYASFVDMEWLVDQQLSNSAFGANMTEAETARVASQAASQGGMRAVISALSIVIVLPLAMLIGALYYWMATKITGVERSFRHWFSLCCWTTVPQALVVIPAAIVLLTASSNQLPQEALQPLSLNELFFHKQPRESGFTLFSNISLLHFVSMYLGITGLKIWSRRSWLYSIVINALPLAVIFGVWALFASR